MNLKSIGRRVWAVNVACWNMIAHDWRRSGPSNAELLALLAAAKQKHGK